MLTGAQIRMARGYLRWSVERLAKEAGVGISTVQRMEKVDGVPAASAQNLAAIEAVLRPLVRFTEDGCVCPPKADTEAIG